MNLLRADRYKKINVLKKAQTRSQGFFIYWLILKSFNSFLVS